MASAARRLLVGGNWKCNNTLAQSKALITSVINGLKFTPSKVGIPTLPGVG
jgi:triosephosphate isomerase